MITAAEYHALDEMLRRNEGVRTAAYRDSLGIPTIGVGFNLKRKDARAVLADLGVSYDEVIAGKAMSDVDVSRLLRFCIDECVADVRALVPTLDDMPIEAQLVLIDLRFNVGPKSFRGFNSPRGTLFLFRNGHYKGAAIQLEGSKWARQVGSRAVRSIQMLRRLTNGEHLP